MKITLITPTSEQVLGFRANLIKCLQSRGHDISIITFDRKREQEIIEKGIGFFCVNDNNRSTNPFKLLSLKKRLTACINKIRPDLVFTFMLKPNIYGALAAGGLGIDKIYCMVEGAGDVFTNNGLKWRLIRAYVSHMYKRAFKHAKRVFFLNSDDKKDFISKKLVKSEQCVIINGIGVDLEKFAFVPLTNYNTFLMVARMLKAKGVIEYCNAARLVKRRYPNVIFNYLGSEETVKKADIQQYIDDGSINYLGTTSDVRPYLSDCSVFVLPSYYREGRPMSIMEAEAVGRAIITTDSIGCRESVEENNNGFLIAPGSAELLAEKCIYLLENSDIIEKMGVCSRRFAEENFDQNLINNQIVDIILADDCANSESCNSEGAK